MRTRMNKCKLLLVVLLGMASLTTFAASKEKADEPKRVYMYGVSVNFNDSVVYMTDVQYLDSMIINKDGSIQNCANYSIQMKVYLEGMLGESNQTCAVIYSDNKKKLEKRYVKMRKRYQTDKNRLIKQVGADVFQFRKE